MKTQEVLNKYFKDEKTIFFNISDIYRMNYGEPYLTYSKDGGIHLFLCNNDGEICILHTTDGNKLEKVINDLIY